MSSRGLSLPSSRSCTAHRRRRGALIRRGRVHAGSRPISHALAAESLEPRTLLAVTATLFGSDLQISLGASDDVAYLSNDGTNYIVRGTGLSGFAAATSSVNSVSVAGTAAVNQSFTIAAGAGPVLTDPLSVVASVESTSVVGAIDTVGAVTIGSGLITIAADVTTTGKQDYQGDVALVGARTLSAGGGDVAFGGTVDSSALLFADPDAFASGTDLTNAFSGLTLSDAGTSPYAEVTSALSGVFTATTGDYAPTGNRVFGPGDWNATSKMFKAAFASSVTSVSLDFGPNDDNDPNAYIEAYDALGNKVALAMYPSAIPELSSVTLTVSAPNIAYVLASFDPDGGNTGLLDNLRAKYATTPSASLTVTSSGTTTFGGAVGGISALGNMSTNAGGTVSLKSVTTTGAQSYGEDATLNGTYTTTDSGFTVSGNTSLAGATAVSTGVGAGNVLFSKALDGASALSLTAGTGNVTFSGLVGNVTPLGAITINSAADVTANGIRAASLTQMAGSGTTTLNSGTFTSAPAGSEAVRTSGAAAVSLTGTNLAVNALVTTANGGTVTFDTSGTITIAAAGDIASDGAVSLTGDGGITTAGDVTTTIDPVTFASATTLSGPVAIGTGVGLGNILFSQALDGDQTLSLAAGTGTITFNGAVGSVAPLGGIAILSAASTTADSTIKLDGSSKLATDGLAISGSVNNVSFRIKGSGIRNFTGNGVFFMGGSTNSLLSGFTVAGNGNNGMRFARGSYAGTAVTANTISDNGDKTAGVGNGILVQGSGLMIGWDANPHDNTAQNIITANALNGIEVHGESAMGNSMLSNSIFLNGVDGTGGPLATIASGTTVATGKGIALTDQGNGSQVAPIIHDVVWDKRYNDDVVRVQVIVPADGTYFVQVFSNTAADEQGVFPVDVNAFEGRTLVGPDRSGSTPVAGSKPTITGAGVISGNGLATLEIPASRLAAGDWLTATATLVLGATPTNTSPFSAGVQVPNAPALAVGGDGAVTWNPEYAYKLVNQNELRVFTENGQAAVALHRYRNLEIVLAPLNAAAGANVVRTVAGATCVGGGVVRLKLKPGAALPPGGGNLVLAPVSLPAARLYDASNGTVLLDVGATHIASALQQAGLTAGQSKAFADRFQGGLRVAHADLDGDGYADLVTAPGAIPTGAAGKAANAGPLRQQIGDAPRVITVYNGNPAGAWKSASVNVSSVFGTTYTGGFIITLGDVRAENAGSGSAVAELIVASTTTVAVFDVAVAARGGQPTISSAPSAIWTTQAGRLITGLTSGDFSAAATDDIVVATTTTAGNAVPARNDVTKNTAYVQSFGASEAIFVPGNAFAIASLVPNGPTPRGYQQNVFFNGAGLATGDIDGASDRKPELVLAATMNGLANVRVLANDLVALGSQQAIDQALTAGNGFTQPSRDQTVTVNGKKAWQPAGGPDYFTGMPSVPNAVAIGANAPLSVTVVDTRGVNNGRAGVFTSLGATNSTNNVVRCIQWTGSAWTGAATLDGLGSITVLPTPGSTSTRFPLGRGLRLG